MQLQPYENDIKSAEPVSASASRLGPPQQTNHLEALFRSAPVGLCLIDLDFRFQEANDHLARLFDLPLETLLEQSVKATLSDSADAVIAQLQVSLSTKKPIQVDLNVPRGNRQIHCVFSAEPLMGSSGEVLGFSAAFLETRQATEAEEAAREEEEHLRAAVVLTNQVLWTANAEGKFVDIDESWAQLTGRNREHAFGDGWVQVVHPDDQPTARERWENAVLSSDSDRYEDIYRVFFSDQGWRWVMARAVPRVDQDGRVHVWYGTLEDIHERKQMEEALSMKTEWLEDATQQIASLAQEDHLTGLANRRRLDSVLKDEVKRAGRSEKGVALIMLDVDHFKQFNDRLGHIAGDGCLRDVAIALRGVLHRPGDFVARFGGEEFVILLPNTDEAGAFKVAEHAIAAVRDLGIRHPGNPGGVVTISAGVGVLDAASSDAANEQILLERADSALYAAKSAGRNRVAGSSQLR